MGAKGFDSDLLRVLVKMSIHMQRTSHNRFWYLILPPSTAADDFTVDATELILAPIAIIQSLYRVQMFHIYIKNC